jgi:hypothetical protein
MKHTWGHDYRILVGKPDGKRQEKEPDIDGRIILKWILER